MPSERAATSKGQAGSTRLLSTEELFEGLNEIYESAEAEGETVVSSATSGPGDGSGNGSEGAHAAHLQITESGDAFNVRAELHSFDSAETSSSAAVQHTETIRAPRKPGRKANPVLRAIDLIADADRENITATVRGGMLEVKMPKGRKESLAAARSALLASVVSGRPQSV
jgi:HSP20 family molecular chaperone IbpA